MTATSRVEKLMLRSPDTATRADRPDLDQRAILHDVIVIVEVHRGIAMRHGRRSPHRRGAAACRCRRDESGMFVPMKAKPVSGRRPSRRWCDAGRQSTAT
ncbi:hypothetical protein AB5I41_08250 [Sphingomonas sp. MMS24-JH45]